MRRYCRSIQCVSAVFLAVFLSFFLSFLPFCEFNYVICFQNCPIVAWFTKDGSDYHFEIQADYTDGDVEGKWVGVGLGLDGGRGMGDDAVVACFKDIYTQSSHTDNYWNVIKPIFYSYPVAVSI